MNMNNLALWSDGWWIEDKQAWFIQSEMGILCSYSFDDGTCNFVAVIPDKEKCVFRKYIHCIKVNSDIYLLPDTGTSILCYSLKNNVWTDIKIENANKSRLACRYFLKKENNIYILSNGLKKIIQLDLFKRQIVRYYSLPEYQNDVLGAAFVALDKIFVVSSVYPQIYIFDCSKLEVIVCKLSSIIDDNLWTVCYQNKNIWLSGKKKKIYRWDMVLGEVNIYESFPSDFGIYNFSNNYNKTVDCEMQKFDVPAFVDSIQISKYIWFIPFQTNKIIYLDLETNLMNEFEIEDEEEIGASLKNRFLNHKYLLEYVRDKRYIGLFSVKNEHVIEIDVELLTYRILTFVIDVASFTRLLFQIFTDRKKVDREIFTKLLENSKQDENKIKNDIGRRIHNEIKLY